MQLFVLRFLSLRYGADFRRSRLVFYYAFPTSVWLSMPYWSIKRINNLLNSVTCYRVWSFQCFEAKMTFQKSSSLFKLFFKNNNNKRLCVLEPQSCQGAMCLNPSEAGGVRNKYIMKRCQLFCNWHHGVTGAVLGFSLQGQGVANFQKGAGHRNKSTSWNFKSRRQTRLILPPAVISIHAMHLSKGEQRNPFSVMNGKGGGPRGELTVSRVERSMGLTTKLG